MTFTEWLRGQEARDDVVDDMARDAAADSAMPQDGTRQEYEAHMRVPDGVFGEVWTEYEKAK